MHTQDYSPSPQAIRRGARESQIRRLGYATYDDYLRSPQWRDKRAAYFASDRPQACVCGEKQRMCLHHMTYERVGEELLEDLIALCAGCHTLLHALERVGDGTLDPSSVLDILRPDSNHPDPAEMRKVLDGVRAMPLSERVPALRALAVHGNRSHVESKLRSVLKLIRRRADDDMTAEQRANLARMVDQRLESAAEIIQNAVVIHSGKTGRTPDYIRRKQKKEAALGLTYPA